MIHAYSYSDGTGFIEVKNCNDDAGKPVIYAKQFESVAEMQHIATQLGETLNCGIVWKFEEVTA